MNSVKELVSYGIDEKTANNMIANFLNKVGTINGDYEIVDITFHPGTRVRKVTLKCTKCGETIYRDMICGRNKWSELIKTCKKCKIAKKNNAAEKSKKIKKELLEAEIGKIYGDYKVVGIVNGSPDKLKLSCTICGAEKAVSFPSVQTGKWTNHRCTKHYSCVKYDESYIGKRFGFLTVIGINEPGEIKRFKCRCDCGNTKNIRPIELVSGKAKSCGCFHDEFCKTHGGSKERLYRVWQDMKRRCESTRVEEYRNYGGRGIKVCEEWHDYSIFREWAYANGYDENAPFGECTIDRIDVNGNYEPNNCRWITNAEQQKNKRPSSEWKKRENVKKTALILYDGKMIPKSDLCKQCGISVETFNYRYLHKGMSIEEALKTPKMTEGRPRKEKCS